MAKYYSSTFGKISGKHGTAVAVIRKDGSTYLRLHVKASNPRTEKQQAHRAKFALSSKALVPFNPIFKETIGITNGISIARSYAFKNAIGGEYPNFKVDYEKIMFSFGDLEPLHNASHTRDKGAVTVNWSFNEMYNCHGDDLISLVVFNKDTKQTLHIKDIAKRSDKEVKVGICDYWTDSDLHLWAYVTRDDKKSDSVSVEMRVVGLANEDTPPNDKFVEIDKYEYPDKDKQKTLPVQSWFGASIMSVIVMILNLLNVFKQEVVEAKGQCFVNGFTNNVLGVNKYIGYIYKYKVPRVSLKPTRSRLHEVFYLQYSSIFSRTLIPKDKNLISNMGFGMTLC